MSLSKVRWEVDPERPLRTGFFPDHNTGDLTIVHEEDVEFILKKNQQMMNASTSRCQEASEWKHWARIPNIIAMKWKADYGIDVMKSEDWPKVRALLHQKEWSKLRVAPGSFQARPAREYPSTRRSRVISKIGSGSYKTKGSYGAT